MLQKGNRVDNSITSTLEFQIFIETGSIRIFLLLI